MSTAATAKGARPRTWPWVLVLSGFATGLLGLLPWLLTGARLPLQNLWDTEIRPGDMPLVLLPFSQYALTLLPGMLVWGSALAGCVVRLHPVHARLRGAMVATLGFLAVAVIATSQTALVVHGGLRADDPRTDRYFVAVLSVIVASVVVGIVVLALLACGRRPSASIAATVAALAGGIWLDALIATPFGGAPSTLQVELLSYSRWLPALFVGAVLVWCGVGGLGNAVAWAVSPVLLWVLPAGFTAVNYAAGSRVLAGDLEEMRDAALDVFRSALGPAGPSLEYAGVALGLGVLGTVIRACHARRRASSNGASDTTPAQRAPLPDRAVPRSKA
ncbi:hypothetical protein EXU48_15765 [Occultella glacieicola]|uniref:Integral membrane protein n=1 Tax=Occultella glacieicola TaxID=2518684 RepID=A0ABY2E103_9MICO|nr:hypothetical protein [Occultella glacieicola]TDE91600.1 hypothetical protein EXU48_15765 [Occultella glacieicola]